jgi:hypothetical protein
MLPYPTDRRRLLMMVRAFLHEFSAFVTAHAEGWECPSDPCDACADRQLEEFLERLGVDASQIDDGCLEIGRPVETEAEIVESLEGHLRNLVRHATWNHNRISAN